MNSDRTFPPEAYLLAHDIARNIEQNMAIQFQMEGVTWDRDKMQKHANDRAALIRAQKLILDAGEKVAGIKPTPPAPPAAPGE